MYCGDRWDAVPSGSVLTVKLALAEKTVVAGTITVARPDGSTRQARINAGHFPLKVRIGNEATHEVKFTVMHSGAQVKYAIDARVVDPDGTLFGEPFVCEGELTEEEPAFTVRLVADASS